MATFICTVCQHKFDAEQARPDCPQGCKRDMTDKTRHGDTVTTLRVSPNPVGRPRKDAAPDEPAGKAKKPAKRGAIDKAVSI